MDNLGDGLERGFDENELQRPSKKSSLDFRKMNLLHLMIILYEIFNY